MGLHRWLAAVLVLALFSGACDGDELTLGHAAPVVDLDRCQATDCAPEPTTPRELEAPEHVACQRSEIGEIETAFFFELWPGADECAPLRPSSDATVCSQAQQIHLDCPGFGACLLPGLPAVVLSPDGNIWTAAAFSAVGAVPGTPDSGGGGVWLQRFAQDGTRLSSESLAGESVRAGEAVSFTANLQVDGRGHAFVLIARRFGTARQGEVDWDAPSTISRWVLEFDEYGRRAGASIELIDEAVLPGHEPDVLELLPAGAGLFFVAHAFGGGGVGMFDLASRETRWVQNRTGRLGIAQAAVDPAHEVTVTTRSPNGSLSGRLEHYRSDGSLAWERQWPKSTSDQRGDPSNSALRTELEGSVSLLLFDWNGGSELYRMNRDGEPMFAIRYDALEESPLNATTAQSHTVVAMPSGTIVSSPLMLIDENRDEPTITNLIVAVSSDGARCKRHTWRHQHANYIQLLVRGDVLYFSSPDGFGRLELPADFEP